MTFSKTYSLNDGPAAGTGQAAFTNGNREDTRMTNPSDGAVSYAQSRELLGEMRRQMADYYKTWSLPGDALGYTMWRDGAIVARGYLSPDGFNRAYLLEVVA